MGKLKNDGEKKPDPLKDKSFSMAIRIVNLYKFLTLEKQEYVMSKQILRCGTNPGAMVREAKNSESDADWIHKLSVAQKEAGETQYWLELLFATNYLTNEQYQSIFSDVDEVCRLIASSILTKKRGK
jgi:four helix bundle protein